MLWIEPREDWPGAGGDGIQTEEAGRILPQLTTVQAMILLGLPKEERVQFLMEADVESMSTRELKEAVEHNNLNAILPQDLRRFAHFHKGCLR